MKDETKNSVFRDFDYDNSPIVDLVNDMIYGAFQKRASDIHFDPTEDALNVRIRIDGELVNYAKVPNSVRKNLATRVKIISGMNITEMRLPQDGAIKTEFDGKPLDMRVSSLPITDGEKIVIRILDYAKSLEGLETLGFTKDNLNKINRMIQVPNGIILTTGATGSGKSTTVYAILQKLNKSTTNIITVEDPVEMKILGLNQVQVNSEIGLTFANALRSILRQDPDIIMIGEIRDDETARIAVRASITGHLVVSTLHTNNSLNTIERLLDMDVERYLLGTALTGIISQRLAKRLCPKCKKARPITAYEKIVFEKALGKQVNEIYEPVGCSECIKGYLGRIPIHEVLEVNQEVRDAILNNIRKEDLRKLVYTKANVKSLLQDGLIKVLNGITSFEEILRIIDIQEDFGEGDEELKEALLGKYEENEAKKKETINQTVQQPEKPSEEQTSTEDQTQEEQEQQVDEQTIVEQAPSEEETIENQEELNEEPMVEDTPLDELPTETQEQSVEENIEPTPIEEQTIEQVPYEEQPVETQEQLVEEPIVEQSETIEEQPIEVQEETNEENENDYEVLDF